MHAQMGLGAWNCHRCPADFTSVTRGVSPSRAPSTSPSTAQNTTSSTQRHATEMDGRHSGTNKRLLDPFQE